MAVFFIIVATLLVTIIILIVVLFFMQNNISVLQKRLSKTKESPEKQNDEIEGLKRELDFIKDEASWEKKERIRLQGLLDKQTTMRESNESQKPISNNNYGDMKKEASKPNGRKFSFLGIVVILLVIVAIFTNPNEEKHKETLKLKVNTYLQKSLSEDLKGENDDWEIAGKSIGMVLGGAIIHQFINNLVSTDNYLLFSTTKVSWDGETRIVGIGAFGNVFLSSQLDNVLNDGALKEYNN